jgi:hypothetical protein
MTVWVLVRSAQYFGEVDRLVGVYASEETAERARVAKEIPLAASEIEEFEVIY